MMRAVRIRELVGLWVVILLVTAVIPPAAASWLNQRRIVETHARAVQAVDWLGTGGRLQLTPGMAAYGPGRLPDGDGPVVHPAHRQVLGSAQHLADVLASMPVDGWDRCFIVTSTLVMSAGPNGVFETSLTAQVAGGDDIAVARR